jgi:hypothetical protein
MGTRNLVAKNDLYYVDAAGNDWQLVDARKNRAGLHEGHWRCMVFVFEWAVATLVDGVTMRCGLQKHMMSLDETLRRKP